MLVKERFEKNEREFERQKEKGVRHLVIRRSEVRPAQRLTQSERDSCKAEKRAIGAHFHLHMHLQFSNSLDSITFVVHSLCLKTVL